MIADIPELAKLTSLTSQGDRESVIEFVRSNKACLRGILLSDPVVAVEQARKDFQRERVLLNDVPFVPSKTHVFKNYAFASTSLRLVEKLLVIQPDASLKEKGTEICDLVLRRACRTGAGADSIFMVQSFFCVEGTFAKHCSSSTDPPIRISLSLDESSGSLHFKSEVHNTFAVHDVEHLDQLSGHDEIDPAPWIKVEAVVSDSACFSTGEHQRYLDLIVSIPYGNGEFRLL